MTSFIKYQRYEQKAFDRIEDILDRLEIDHRMITGNRLGIKCPVHGSEKIGNSFIYMNTSKWFCMSDSCNDIWGNGIISLIRAVLSNSDPENKVSYQDVYDFIDGGDFAICPRQIKFERANLEFKNPNSHPNVSIPSKYYVDRGISPEALKEFNVGDCMEGPWAQKAVIPVYYIDKEYCGFSARSHFNECKKCGYCHSKYAVCVNPDNEFAFMNSRWLHKIQSYYLLYGIDKHRGERTIVLTEGPSCVWRLWEHKIFACACFNGEFNDHRLSLLKELRIKNVILAFDQDDAGKEFTAKFIRNFKQHFNDGKNIFKLSFPTKDITDMNDDQIKKYIVSKWKKICNI